MGDFFANLPPWLGTLPQLFSAGGIMGILYILTQTYLGRTKNVIEDKRVAIEADKIEGEIEAKLRDHFASELKRLREEINAAKEDVEAAKLRQTQCEEREQALRGRVRKLEDQLTGIVRSLSVEGSLRILDITEHPSDDIIRAAISSLENIIAKRSGDKK